jgi:hypothetical protein
LRINHYVAGETEGQRTGVNEIVKEGKSGGVTFLTAVAGTAVLGVQFAILTPFMARCGEPVGVCSFALDHSNYRFLPLLPWQRPKPSLEVAINRFWLLVSWKFCTILQPFIGGYTVFPGDRNGGRRIGKDIRKGLPLPKPTPPHLPFDSTIATPLFD